MSNASYVIKPHFALYEDSREVLIKTKDGRAIEESKVIPDHWVGRKVEEVEQNGINQLWIYNETRSFGQCLGMVITKICEQPNDKLNELSQHINGCDFDQAPVEWQRMIEVMVKKGVSFEF